MTPSDTPVTFFKIRLRMDRRRSARRKDGTFPIVINVPHGTHAVLINTDISLPPETWDDRTQLYTGPGAQRVNNTLTALLGGVQRRAVELRATGRWAKLRTPADIRAALSGNAAVIGTTDVVGYMQRHMQTIDRPKTRLTYANTLDHLRRYTDGAWLDFDDLTPKWLRDFSDWLRRHERLAVNSVAIHLRNLRTVVNRAIDDEITSVYGFRRFSIRTEATPHRALSPDRLRRLLAAPVIATEEEYRDIFLLGFLLLGINLADLSRLRAVEDGRINYRRAKTGKLYSVRVEPEAQEIIDRYRGREHLLAPFDRYADHQDYARRLNYALKHLGGTEIGFRGKRTYHPIEPALSYYWCRHTWATIASSIGIPEDTIRHALGHGGRTVTDIYIDYDIRHVDEANRRVIDYVLYGKE